MTATRRLAAILAADVAGYSRLMGADEEGTLAALKAIRRELGDLRIEELAAQRFGGVRACLPRPPPSAGNTPPHRRRGSRRAGGSGSFRLADRQPQARQQQLAVLGVGVKQIPWYDQRGNGAQPSDNRARFVEPPHMGIARGENAVRRGKPGLS